MFGRKAGLPENWEHTVRAVVPNWDGFSEEDRAAYIETLEWAYAEIAWDPVAGFSVDDTMRITLSASLALIAMGLDNDALGAATHFIVWPDEIPAARATPLIEWETLIPWEYRGGSLRGSLFPMNKDPFTVPLPLALSWAEVRACVENPELGRNPVLRAAGLCIDLADGHVDGLPPLSEDARAAWLAVIEPIFVALDAGEERLPLEPDDAADAGAFFGAITEAFFLCAKELQDYEPDLYALLAEFYSQDPAARATSQSAT